MASRGLISALIGAGQGIQSGQELRLAETLRQLQLAQREAEVIRELKLKQRLDQETYDSRIKADEQSHGRLAESATARAASQSRAYLSIQDDLDLDIDSLSDEQALAYHQDYDTNKKNQQEQKLRKISNRRPQDLSTSIDTSIPWKDNLREDHPNFDSYPVKRQGRLNKKYNDAHQRQKNAEEKDQIQLEVAEKYANSRGASGGLTDNAWLTTFNKRRDEYLEGQLEGAANQVAVTVNSVLLRSGGGEVTSLSDGSNLAEYAKIRNSLRNFYGPGTPEADIAEELDTILANIDTVRSNPSIAYDVNILANHMARIIAEAPLLYESMVMSAESKASEAMNKIGYGRAIEQQQPMPTVAFADNDAAEIADGSLEAFLNKKNTLGGIE